jgi:poly-gamma-glutamate synthesis protein (capsule biosynthesis protein)
VLLSLVWAGFDVICLANNHMTDYGREAAAETAALLDVAGLAHCGAGANLAEARKPAVLSSGGVSVAIVAYVQSGLGSVEATEDSGGVALAKDDYLAEDIRTARAVADIVIVSVHWGDEFQHVPNRFQVDFARKAIDSGADAVVGHHPHVIQGAEIYQGKPIFYSLGNFAFDMRDDPTYEGLAVEFSLVKEGIVSIEVLPISIERKTFRPSIATGKKAESALKTFIRSSETLGLLCRYDESLERVVLDKFSSAD